MLELVHRFSREQPLHQHMSRVTADLVSLLEESEKWKKANHNPNQQSFYQYGIKFPYHVSNFVIGSLNIEEK